MSELLWTVSEHTTTLRDAVWLRHIRYNEEHYGFDKTLADISHEGKKAVVLGTSPLFKRFGLADLEAVMNSGVVTVACDIALPLLAELGKPPTYSVSVDSHPVVANFYRRSQTILPHVTPILSTTIHRDVVEECRKAGTEVRWLQGYRKENSDFHRANVSGVTSGGNVGTTCFIIAAHWFRCTPVGLLGFEFAWSDETPYFTLKHLKKLLRASTSRNPDMAIRGRFERFTNQNDGKTYVADYTYCQYLDWFREIWRGLPREVKENTFNLTKEGILSARGLKNLSVNDFLAL